MGHKRRGKAADRVKVGDWVKSKFRSPWRGVVLAKCPGDCVTVRVLLSGRGQPLRKPLTKTINRAWLIKLPG